MSKWFYIILVGLVAGLIGIYVVFNKDPQPIKQVSNPTEITGDDHSRGPKNAPVTLVEYGDFQCPACGAAEPLLKQAQAEFKDDLRFVWRHFPLTSIHPNAYAAAQTTEAAAAQGKFWEMHDLLFERQTAWSTSANARKLFEDYARELGLNIDQYQKDLSTSRDRISRDVAIAQQLKVDSTPTLYLNGEKVEPNPRNYAELKRLIEAKLKASE